MAERKRALSFLSRGRKSVLSGSEVRFHDTLKAAVGDEFMILLKVGMRDLSEMTKRAVERKLLDRVGTMIVDFVLCDPKTTTPIVAVELDDVTTYGRERAERDRVVDAVFAAMGVALIRARVQPTYDAAAIAGWVHAAAARRQPPLPRTPLRPAS